jgi:hypothetical protein
MGRSVRVQTEGGEDLIGLDGDWVLAVHMSKERSGDCHFFFIEEPLDHEGCVAIKDMHGGFL